MFTAEEKTVFAVFLKLLGVVPRIISKLIIEARNGSEAAQRARSRWAVIGVEETPALGKLWNIEFIPTQPGSQDFQNYAFQLRSTKYLLEDAAITSRPRRQTRPSSGRQTAIELAVPITCFAVYRYRNSLSGESEPMARKEVEARNRRGALAIGRPQFGEDKGGVSKGVRYVACPAGSAQDITLKNRMDKAFTDQPSLLKSARQKKPPLMVQEELPL